MTNKELLEYAAKAAGYTDIQYEDGWWLEVRYGLTEAFWNGEDYWNPLEDNDDAFRLAVKLRLEVGFPKENVVWSFGHTEGDISKEFDFTNPYEATRRAIVRAAAEIGKEQA